MTRRTSMTQQGNPTKISFVYSNPTDPQAFEAAYPEQREAGDHATISA